MTKTDELSGTIHIPTKTNDNNPNVTEPSDTISISSMWYPYPEHSTYVSIDSKELIRLQEIERKYKAMRDLLHKIIDEVIDIASDNNDK